MNKYRKLFSNSLVFAIGNLGSKMITFFMVPVYTRYLSTSDYGNSDVLSTLVSLLTPVLTLSITDAVFRFAMDKESNNVKVLTNGLLVSVISIILFIVSIPVLLQFKFGVYVVALTLASAIESMLQEFARGIGKSKLFAVTGIIMTALTVVSNIVLIVFLKIGLDGYLASMLVAQVGGALFLFAALKGWNYLNFRDVDRSYLQRMLIYSLPLIPNTISWWLSNSASKLFIAFMLGSAANGIYAVANKIPSLVSVFYAIFTQAWQISAVEEFKEESSGQFFSQVLNVTIGILLVGVSFLTLLAVPLVHFLATPSYYSAADLVPWLSLAVFFSSISAFLGTVYTASMKTGGLFTTTIVGAVTNVLCNLVLIPLLGITGAAIGAMISFAVVSWIRYRSSRKFVHLSINWTLFCPSLLLIFGQILLHLYMPSTIGQIFEGIFLLLLVLLNFRSFVPAIGVFFKK